jgi:hypothetical protein
LSCGRSRCHRYRRRWGLRESSPWAARPKCRGRYLRRLPKLGLRSSPSTGLRDASAPIGTRPPQRMRAVLLTGSLSSHRIASSIDGSLASSFDSKLLGGTMAAARVQNIAWRGWFPSSQFGQINSPKRKTLRTSFFFFKVPLKFSDRRRKSKRSNSGKNRGRRPYGTHLGRSAWAGRPTLSRGPGRSGFSCTALFSPP